MAVHLLVAFIFWTYGPGKLPPMIRPASLALPLIAGSLALSGCIAKTALDVVTAPVKLAGSAVDAATTSQSESDEKRGRELRQREERLGKLERQYRAQEQDCQSGDDEACTAMDQTRAEMEQL